MSKTEKPTPRRLKKARAEGDLPFSNFFLVCGSLSLGLAILPKMLAAGLSVWREELILAVQFQGDPQKLFTGLGARLAKDVLLLTLPILLLAAAATVLVGLGQTGGNIAPKRLHLDLGRLTSGGGLRRIFSGEPFGRIFRGLLGAASVLFALLMLLKHHAVDIAASLGNLPGAFLVAGELSYRLGWVAAGGALLLGSWEFFAAYGAFLARHRMSRAEVQAEAREAEADPDLRARRRQLEAAELQRQSAS